MSRFSTHKAAEMEALRSKIWDLYLGSDGSPGKTQFQIGEIIGRKQQVISYHIIKSLTQLKHDNAASTQQYLSCELKKCALGEDRAWKVYDEAIKAWKRSIGTVRTITKTGKPQQIEGQLSVSDAEITIKEEKLAGDASMLRAMNDASRTALVWHERRCKLLGLDAPKKVTVVDERDPINLPDSELEKSVLRMAQALTTGIQPLYGNGNNGNGHDGKPN